MSEYKIVNHKGYPEPLIAESSSRCIGRASLDSIKRAGSYRFRH